MNDIEIRKATFSDFDNVKNLMLKALTEDPFAFGSSFEEYNNNSDYWWNSYLSPYLSGNKDIMFIATQDQQPVAMAGLLYNTQERKFHSALIAWVYVLKEQRRKGLASKLMQNILEEAKNKGLKKLILYVNVTQEEALEFYKKLGFELSGTLKRDLFINNTYVDTNIMELFL